LQPGKADPAYNGGGGIKKCYLFKKLTDKLIISIINPKGMEFPTTAIPADNSYRESTTVGV
jgi:hypothetical protein